MMSKFEFKQNIFCKGLQVDLLEELSRIRELTVLFQREANGLYKIGMQKMEECDLFVNRSLSDNLVQEVDKIWFASK
jgi:hypothetical protein